MMQALIDLIPVLAFLVVAAGGWLIGLVCGFHLVRSTAAVKWFEAAAQQQLERSANVARIKEEFREAAAEDDRQRELAEWPDEVGEIEVER